jgi:hypothetical protein
MNAVVRAILQIKPEASKIIKKTIKSPVRDLGNSFQNHIFYSFEK